MCSTAASTLQVACLQSPSQNDVPQTACFCAHVQSFPAVHDAIGQITCLISHHPEAPLIQLCCEGLGSELIIESVAKTFNIKVHNPPPCTSHEPGTSGRGHACSQSFQTELLHKQRCAELQLLVPESLTTSAAATKIHVHGGRDISKHGRDMTSRYCQGVPPLIIKASTQAITLARTDQVQCARYVQPSHVTMSSSGDQD
eukprot:jgi/Chrzof1/14633/Cz09g10060.t1